MQYHALAADYDGTLATDGRVDDDTIAALRRLRESGRRLVLVTGRIVDQLLDVFPQIGLCNLVVADNGALLYDPETDERTPLHDPPPREFVEELVRRGVPNIEVGDVIVATWEPHETTVLETIRDLGLELQIIFNKGAVMILPTGVNKATGLRCALKKLGLSHHNTVGVGDAENDEAFLKLCEASAAVDNALEVVKRQVDIVTTGARGAGVTELINQMTDGDLRNLTRCPKRCIVLGSDLEGKEFRVPVYGTRALVTGGRHRHGYLEGDMDAEHRFYFRGPNGELNLPAQNLRIFMQVGEGVDDDTWLYHLREGDYDRWFRDVIKDEDLAKQAEKLRSDGENSAADSRVQIFGFICKKYEWEA